MANCGGKQAPCGHETKVHKAICSMLPPVLGELSLVASADIMLSLRHFKNATVRFWML